MPPRLADSPPTAPRATSATPEKETAAASQRLVPSRSTPKSCEKMPAKIGSVPKISATVEALANSKDHMKAT